MYGWFLGPLLGALVGYVHAWVAVKMIFWPRKEYRLFGRRIPGTPGLFVARRRDFARQLALAFVERFCAPVDVTRALGQALDAGLEEQIWSQIDVELERLPSVLRAQIRGRLVQRLTLFPDEVVAMAVWASDFVKKSGLVDKVMISNIDAMSVDEIESMVRTVCARELKAIVWSGAALGLVIGLVQQASRALFG